MSKLKILKYKDHFSAVQLIFFSFCFAIVGAYFVFGSHAATGAQAQLMANTDHDGVTKVNLTRQANSTVYNWPSTNCASCNAAIGTAAALPALVNNDSQMLAESKQIIDGAIAAEVQPGVLAKLPTDGSGEDEIAMFFANDLGPALLMLRPQLSQAEINSWTSSITNAAQWLAADGNLSFYTNGNIVVGNMGVEALAYQLTGNPIYKQYYDQAYTFALNPDQSSFKGFGFITTKQPTKTDGSDGAGYFAEAGNGTNSWIPKGAGAVVQTSTQKLNNKNTLQLTTTAAANDGTSSVFTLQPNTTYTFTTSAMVASGSISDLSIGYHTGGTDSNCLSNKTVTTTWTQFSCNFTTGSSVAGSNFYIKKTGAAAETIYFGGIQIQAGQNPSFSLTPGDPGLDVDYMTLQLDQLTRVWLVNHDPNILKLMNMEINTLINHSNLTGQSNAPECTNSILLWTDSGGGSRHGTYPRCIRFDTSAYAVVAANGRTDLQTDLTAQLNLVAAEFGSGMALGVRNYTALGMIPVSIAISDLGLFQATHSPAISTDVTAPSKPANVTGSVNGSSITINWSASTDNVGVTKYYIRRNGSLIATTGAVTTFTDTTPVVGTAYSYTATAGDDAGNVSARSVGTPSLTVTTAAAPTVTLTPNPPSITVGNSSTLTWTSTNATSCAATSPSGWTALTTTSGSQSVSPTATTTYTLTCTGTGGSTPVSATVTVSSGVIGDLNNDGHVNSFDLSIFLNHWLQSGSGLAEDFDKNGVVNAFDLNIMLSHWGT